MISVAYVTVVIVLNQSVTSVDKRSRTHDQMVQVFDSEELSPQAQTRRAARSGTQNIAEGYKQESLKGYIKLTGVNRGSLEKLYRKRVEYRSKYGKY